MTTLNWSSALALVGLGVVTLLIWRRYMSPISNIPGPFLASFTRLWHMHRILKGDQNLELIRLHEKHGHFVRISHDEVSVSHPEAIRKVLLAPLHKGPWYKIHALPDYRFQSPMSTTDPKIKSERSKYVTPAYTTSSILRQEEFIGNAVEPLLEWLDSYASSKKPMDLSRFLSFATFDVIGEVIFSTRFGFLEQGKDIGNAIDNSLSLNAYAAVAGYFSRIHFALLANPVVTWLGVLPMGHLFNTTQKAIGERMTNQDARFDAISYWFRQHREHPQGITIRDIHTQALGAVGAGSDTVACGLQSFIYHMIRTSGAWSRVRKEIDEARAAGRCGDRIISHIDAQQLEYFQACIKEALRVFGPVPMGLPRVAPKGGLTIGDRTIPEGTIVSVSPWVIHHSKELWGEDAREFKPERWLSENIRDHEKYWIPFGAGFNSCPGQNLAKIELSKIASTIVRDYDIFQVQKEQQWKWKAYFTVVPHSWPVFIAKRADNQPAMTPASISAH